MIYKLWNKKTAIYDITAEQAIINNPLYGSENSYLFYRDDGSIYDILPISIIRSKTELDESKTDDEVCEAYIKILTAPHKPIDEIAILKDKNAELESNINMLKTANENLEDSIVKMIISGNV